MTITSYLTTGPVAQFAWDYSRVSGYGEDGDDSTAMRFNDQTYHSQIGALGWRLDTQFGVFNPYAEVSYQHQFGDDVYRAGGGLKSTQTSFTRDSAGQDKTGWMSRWGQHAVDGQGIGLRHRVANRRAEQRRAVYV